MKGWKTVSSSNGVTVKTNGENAYVLIHGTFSCSAWNTFGGTVPSGYRPMYDIKQFTSAGSSSNNTMTLQESGAFISHQALSNTPVHSVFYYPLP